MLGLITVLGAGCTGRMTKIGVGTGVGVAAASCVPLLVQGDGTMGPPMLAATGGVVGGAIVVGSLIGYAIGLATSDDQNSPPAPKSPKPVVDDLDR